MIELPVGARPVGLPKDGRAGRGYSRACTTGLAVCGLVWLVSIAMAAQAVWLAVVVVMCSSSRSGRVDPSSSGVEAPIEGANWALRFAR